LKGQGTTFSDLLRDVRLELAQTLLKQSDLSMTEIAERLGYRELSAFSRAFKTQSGMAPNTFRLKLKVLPQGR
jgi:AraC-like DNA-binding protein